MGLKMFQTGHSKWEEEMYEEVSMGPLHFYSEHCSVLGKAEETANLRPGGNLAANMGWGHWWTKPVLVECQCEAMLIDAPKSIQNL